MKNPLFIFFRILSWFSFLGLLFWNLFLLRKPSPSLTNIDCPSILVNKFDFSWVLVSEKSGFIWIISLIEGIGFWSIIEEIVSISEEFWKFGKSFSSWVDFWEKFKLKRVSMSMISLSDWLRSKFIFSSTDILLKIFFQSTWYAFVNTLCIGLINSGDLNFLFNMKSTLEKWLCNNSWLFCKIYLKCKIIISKGNFLLCNLWKYLTVDIFK